MGGAITVSMLLIYSSESLEPVPGTQGFDDYMWAYMTFTEEVKAKGAYVAGDALKTIDTATTIRVRNGNTMTTDGPFAETKEQLGGYYLLECENLDEALLWAAKVPIATHGAIEVRPVQLFD